MKITSLSCTQFAGIRDRSVSLTDGINVVYGRNESGKSTLVNLLSCILFQNAKLDRRSDKEFMEQYFPTEKRGLSLSNDYADGSLSFETDEGRFTLSREWCGSPRSVLSTEDEVIRDEAVIAERLRSVLPYGKGVYAGTLFPSQRSAALALQTILDRSKKNDARQELSDAITQAFAQSDGLTADAIEGAIQSKLDELVGKHWDEERNAPARSRTGGRWSKELGEILKCYYALEDARDVLDHISRLETEADRANADYERKDAEAKSAEEKYSRFNDHAATLALRGERIKTVSRLQAELDKLTAILRSWPKLESELEQARRLETELRDRDTVDQYAKAVALRGELEALKHKLSAMPCPEERELTELRRELRTMSTLENRLCGMNLNAAIRMLDGHTVVIRSLRTGELLELRDSTPITEAVSITVPGVMELRLSPADVDAESIGAQLAEMRRSVQSVFDRYAVSSVEELEGLRQNAVSLRAELTAQELRLSSVLGGADYDALRNSAEAIRVPPRSREDIRSDITALCGSTELSRFIAFREAILQGYRQDYSELAALNDRVSERRLELDRANRAAQDAGDIPPEYADISDPEGHLETLANGLKQCRRIREAALQEKTAAISRLEGFREKLSSDPAEDVERAQRALDEQKQLLAHWKHIASVFGSLKAEIRDNPLTDLAESFAGYLGSITDGRVSTELPSPDKLDIRLYSAERSIDYDKLSEGTKETVSLAFRLAVLDHLFPQGGGVAVLDDPLVNMDNERTAQSVAMIKDFAARHQVIFLTCREEYAPMLGGNLIRL